jgi:hypothetical protein
MSGEWPRSVNHPERCAERQLLARLGFPAADFKRASLHGSRRRPTSRWASPRDWHDLGVSRWQATTDALWAAVDRIVDRAPRVVDLRSHRIELFAARRWRALGRAVPDEIAQRERAAAVIPLTVPALLARVRAAYDGPAILHKGPEVAAAYPDPALRVFGDVDLLIPDAEAAQEALLSAGFELTGDPELYVGIHHLRPLRWGELPLVVEIHSRPKWVDSLPAPPLEDLLAAAVPSRVADGFLALPEAEHALLLAAHSWAHQPLRRIRDFIDIAAVIGDADPASITALARRWDVSKLWRSTADAVDFLFGPGEAPLSIRTWARNLAQARERTVLEHHVERWVSDFWVLPPLRAARTLPQTFVQELRPAPDETWRRKLARSGRAVRNASRRGSEHRDELSRTRPRD